MPELNGPVAPLMKMTSPELMKKEGNKGGRDGGHFNAFFVLVIKDFWGHEASPSCDGAQNLNMAS